MLRWVIKGLFCLGLVDPGAAMAAGRNKVTQIVVRGDTGSSERQVRIETTAQPTFTVFRLSQPTRVVVDISGADLSSVDGPRDVEDGMIAHIATRQFKGDGFWIGRIIVGLEDEFAYDVRAVGHAVVVQLGQAPNNRVSRAPPPPEAPVDRAAAQRQKVAKQEAQLAAQKAQLEQQRAQASASLARQEQRKAKQLTEDANQARRAAAIAKREADDLHRRFTEAAAKEKVAVQRAVREADARLARARSAEVALRAQQQQALDIAAVAERARLKAVHSAHQARLAHQDRIKQLQAESQRIKVERVAMEEAKHDAEVARAQASTASQRIKSERVAMEKVKYDAEVARAQALREAQRVKDDQRVAAQTKRSLVRKEQDIEQRAAAAQEQKKELENKQRTMAKRSHQIAVRSQQLTTKEQSIAARERQLQQLKTEFQQQVAQRASKWVAQEKQERARNKAQKKRPRSQESPSLAARKKVSALPIPVAALIDSNHQTERRVASLTKKRPLPRAQARLMGIAQHSGAILLRVTGRPEFEVQRIEDPPRLIIDLAATKRGTRRTVFGVQNPYVRRIRFGDHGNSVRAVFDLLDTNAKHTIEPTVGGLLVRLKMDAPQKAVRAEHVSDHPAIRNVRFEGNKHRARIIIEMPGEVQTKIDDRSKKAWVLSLRGVILPKNLERSLDTSAYHSVVRLVSIYQDSPSVVKIVANLNGAARQSVLYQQGQLIWEILGSEIDTSTTVATSAISRTAGFASAAVPMARSVPAQKKRARKRISIDLKDADIVNVLRLLAEVSGENIVTSDAVSGTITLRLRNVPWDNALDTILKAKSYDMVRTDNIIRIAPAEDIQHERELAVERRKTRTKAEDTLIKIITVNYATASDISDQIQAMLTERGTVQVDDRTNTIIVEDTISNIQRVVDLTQRLDRQTPQVLIEARIVEANTNYLEHLGIQWGGASQSTSVRGNPTGLLFPNDVIVAGAGDDASLNQTAGVSTPSNYAVNLPAPISSGSGGGVGFVFGSAGGSHLLNLRLSALEEQGEGRVISSPRITTLDNRKASISQGVDIPISVVSASGVNTRFIQARLKLEVTPHVTNDGSVLLKIHTEKKEPDFANLGADGDPSIINKQATTEVLVSDGDTTVIGGIYTRTTSEATSGIPFLSSIPIFGALFRSTRTEDKRSEMLIFVTPRIVNRAASTMSMVDEVMPASLQQGGKMFTPRLKPSIDEDDASETRDSMSTDQAVTEPEETK